MSAKILVTGSSGQLGQCLKFIANEFNFEFVFYDRNTLDICSEKNIKSTFNSSYDFCINCAAYTAVDKAEADMEKANLINHVSVKNIAKACLENDITLLHISTDFVFSGNQSRPYKEDDKANPLSVYGKSKLEGEREIEKMLSKYFIIRTSWLYSQFGHNFVKSMLNLAKTKNTLSIVDDQKGTPTYAMDLAKVILEIINQNKSFGVYHYSNQGSTNWYEFAKAIFAKTNTDINLKPIPTSSYPTAAKRPSYSVLDKTKIMETFSIKIPKWEDGLDKCLKALSKFN